MRYKKKVGKIGEDLASDMLESAGYRIIARNFMTREGEIDIIAIKEGVIHFVEVKTRSSDGFGFPADSVTESKIQRAFDTLAQGRTTLIIAHRLSTIRAASRIVSIADGRITECGTHEELLAAGGIYADLYNTQSKLHD